MIRTIYAIIFFLVISTGCSLFKEKTPEEVVKYFNNQPLVFIPSSNVFPVYGNPKAKIKLDIFFDPWCGPCRKFEAGVLYKLLNGPYKDKIALQYHLFPLQYIAFVEKKEYNDNILASLLHIEMAKRGLFKEFRREVVIQNPKKYADMLDIAENLSKTKLSNEVIKTNTPELNSFIQTVINLQLQATPSVFINSKNVGALSLENIQILIDTLESQ